VRAVMQKLTQQACLTGKSRKAYVWYLLANRHELRWADEVS